MDRRDRNHQWYSSFDAKRMVLVLELDTDIEIPAKWEVCETCDGRGTHVNPSIDSHGISPEEFAEDPDFAEAYFRGDYDQPCNECHGRTTVPVPDEARCGPELMKVINDHLDAEAAYAAECAAERRMGA